MTSHLIKECVKKDLYKQCKKCKESIRLDVYDAHDKAKTCNPWKPANQANRCPLCHTDIAPGEKGWRLHLMSKKCPANERNNPEQMNLSGQAPDSTKELTEKKT